MTLRALLVMVPAWGVITYFTVKYFMKVLRSPGKGQESE